MIGKSLIYRIARNAFHYINYMKLYPQICREKKKTENIIWCESYVKQKSGELINNNWGDDLNKYLFEYITDNKVAFLPFTKIHPFFSIEHYSLIGSIIGFYRLDNVIIYGSGLIDPERKITGKPKAVLSVRGPKTRAALIEKGIECPPVYGDPALLIPLFYKPCIEKKDTITVIYNEATPFEYVKSWVESCPFGWKMKITSMKSYQNWTDVVDEIAESKYVISESLHGLIVAEAFNIPSVWVEFKQHKSFWPFKYEDFYESIGKLDMKSIKIYNGNFEQEILDGLHNWKPGNIQYNEMLNAFPFTLKEEPRYPSSKQEGL